MRCESYGCTFHNMHSTPCLLHCLCRCTFSLKVTWPSRSVTEQPGLEVRRVGDLWGSALADARIATSCASFKDRAERYSKLLEQHVEKVGCSVAGSARYSARMAPSVLILYMCSVVSLWPLEYRRSVRASKHSMAMMHHQSQKTWTASRALACRRRQLVSIPGPSVSYGYAVLVHPPGTPSLSSTRCQAAQTIDSIDRSEYVSGYSKSTLLGRLVEALLRRAPYVRFFVWCAS